MHLCAHPLDRVGVKARLGQGLTQRLGGLIAFGFIGLFIGPTLLAVAYSLLLDWSRSTQPSVQP